MTSVMKISTTKTLEPDEKIFTQNDPSNGLYVLLRGKLRVYIFSGLIGDPIKVLTELNPGQYVGEVGLIHGQARSASVDAVESSQVLFIPATEFSKLLETNPIIARQTIDSLCDLINNHQKLIINSPKALLIKEKKLAPSLSNMRALCTILRMHDKKTAITNR
jgi:CRP-like cAMP-binding protein